MELKDKFFTEYLNSLAPEQWVDLLGADHSFWEYCSCRNEFNGRDWRKLLQCDFEFFADKCNYQKLDTGEWYQLFMDKNLDYKKLLKFCPTVKFNGDQWYKLILGRSELAEIYSLCKLDHLAWHVILLTHPQLAKHCTFGALPEDDWQELIAKKPELAKYKPENA